MHDQVLPKNPNEGVPYNLSECRTIWLAGGCFWGVEAYMARVPGVAETEVGYANGLTDQPTYHELKQTGHAETVRIVYDAKRISLFELLDRFFEIIDPTSLNRQGGDAGKQYRTGIYYRDDRDLPDIKRVLEQEQKKYAKPIVTEVKPLKGFYPAEDYHQKYLEKNPNGYCHVDFSTLSGHQDEPVYRRPSDEELKKTLSSESYHVIRENGTEKPFENAFWDYHEKGLYVDIATGQPLFTSSDKFDSGCGWPSFARPVEDQAVVEKEDTSYNRIRTEIRSSAGDFHLGHVFEDGPKELGGLRYCINSAALRFVPLERMEEEGYGKWVPYVR